MDNSSTMPSCPNCGHKNEEQYCSHCGQSQNKAHPTLKAILIEASNEILETDSRLLRSIARLLFKPGYLTRDYINFRRAHYLPPFRMYVIANIVLYFALNWVSDSVTVSLDVRMPFLETSDNAEFANALALSLLPQVGFLLLPFAAMLTKLLYFNRQMPIGYHFIAVLHMKTAVAMILALAATLLGILTGIESMTGEEFPKTESGIMLVAAITGILHVIISLHVVYKGRLFINLIRSALFLSTYFVLAGTATIVLVLFAAWSVSTL